MSARRETYAVGDQFRSRRDPARVATLHSLEYGGGTRWVCSLNVPIHVTSVRSATVISEATLRSIWDRIGPTREEVAMQKEFEATGRALITLAKTEPRRAAHEISVALRAAYERGRGRR